MKLSQSYYQRQLSENTANCQEPPKASKVFTINSGTNFFNTSHGRKT